MRPTCILAVADGKAKQVIDSLNLELVLPIHPFVNKRIRYERNRITIECIVFNLAQNISLPWQSAGASGDWDIFLLVADPGALGSAAVADDGGYRWLTRIFRKLRQLSDIHPTYLRGPWSLQQLIDNYPAKAEQLFKTDVLDENEQPTGERVWNIPMLAGDSITSLLAIDYRPSQQEIDEDID